ncbi:hypothetical protein CIL03_11345 [Virgibacillus indicus]|uniref:O-antigen ligase-related domain-containing protein n=1 Tax=Virgibacillus indicus TaxID=2024554 RepID=A0A265N8B2_9BACI|nr:hypothetical protein CIL03_11345 [Virgibacillus indicus]
MNNIKYNSLVLVIYIYFTSISLLLAPFINDYFFKSTFLICLIIATLLLNKFKFTRKIIFFYGILTIFICLNLLFVSHKSYVIADGVNLLVYSFIPVYLIGQKVISFTLVKKNWIRFSVLFTFLLPIFYLYRQNGYISYYEIGFLSHLNILILVIHLVEQKRKSIKMIIFLVINVLILAILGSRMVLVASIITSVFTFILLSNKKSFTFYLKSFLMSALVLGIVFNLREILLYINNSISKVGINSRNLSLFISQLEGRIDESTLLSGRDDIYPIIIKYLGENGTFPSGFGIARKLTNGIYYHSHNFLLEMTLIFGITGLIILVSVFLYKIFILIISRKIGENQIMLRFLLILFISFILRSITGTYFATDLILLVCLGIIVSINTPGIKKINNKYQH